MKNKIILLGLILLLLVPAVFAIDTTPTISVRDYTFWDGLKSLFNAGDLAVSVEDGTWLVAKPGELVKTSFRVYCKEAAVSQDFAIEFQTPEGSSIGDGGFFHKDIGCIGGQSQVVTVDDVKLPNFNSQYCGSVIYMKMYHTRNMVGGKSVTDTWGDGYDLARKIKLECNAPSVCEGLTGSYSGSKYCLVNDVMQDQYTNVVKNGKCVLAPQTIKNCGSTSQVCLNGVCITNSRPVEPEPVVCTAVMIEGYIFKDNKCVPTVYDNCGTKPTGFISKLSDCESKIIKPIVNDTVVDEPVVDTPVKNDTVKTNTTTTTGEEKEKSLWQRFIDWLKKLFSY